VSHLKPLAPRRVHITWTHPTTCQPTAAMDLLFYCTGRGHMSLSLQTWEVRFTKFNLSHRLLTGARSRFGCISRGRMHKRYINETNASRRSNAHEAWWQRSRKLHSQLHVPNILLALPMALNKQYYDQSPFQTTELLRKIQPPSAMYTAMT